jgi:PhnB protein
MGKTTELSRRRFALSASALAALPARSIADAKMQKRGGELAATKVKDSPARDFMPSFQQEKIANARLRNGQLEISASDWLRPAQTPIRGNTVCLSLSGGTLEELKTLFERLSDGAEVTDPLKEQFFGTYGALSDKFGVRWMFQTNKKS